MNIIAVTARVFVSMALVIVLFQSILYNGQPRIGVYDAFDTLYSSLTFVALLFMGGFYGKIEE